MRTLPLKRLRAKEIAELYGISISTVWGYTRKGLLTPIRVTKGTTVFKADEVEKLFSIKKEAVNEVA